MSNPSTTEPQLDLRATLLRRTSRVPNDRQKQPTSSLGGDFMSGSNTTSKIGAVFYIIWACLHLLATYSVYALGRSLDSSMVQGRLFQDAWNLMFFSIVGISVAATLTGETASGVTGSTSPLSASQIPALSSSFLFPATHPSGLALWARYFGC